MGESPPTIGWREWIGLPELGDIAVKAKVDTGARTSTLHAYDIEEFQRDGDPWVRFSFHPNQRDSETTVESQARLAGLRRVTASNGQAEMRHVISTVASIDGEQLEIELTLTRRDAMGFRMLLGRRAIRGRFLVDPKRSFRTAESKQARRRAKKERAQR